MSQDELAHRSHLHRAYMGFVEQGKYDIKVVTLNQIARGLDLRPEALLAEAAK